MAHKVILEIKPSDPTSELDAVTAFGEVLDAIDLANETLPPKARRALRWELEKASKNSPFTVEIEATAIEGPEIDFQAVSHLAGTLEYLTDDVDAPPPEWLGAKALNKAKRLFEKNADEVRSNITFPEINREIRITQITAHKALRRIEELLSKAIEWPTELGSVEGLIEEVGRHYKKPSFTLRTSRDSGSIKCIVTDDEVMERIGQEHTWAEAWMGKPVIVSGKIFRDKAGQIHSIEVRDVRYPPSPPNNLEEALDEGFTEGLSAEEYLKKIRGEM